MVPSSDIDDLFSNDQGKCSRAVTSLKSSLIGSNKRKHVMIERGLVPRLIHIINEHKSPPHVEIDVIYALGSIAKGMGPNLKAIIDSGAVPVLLDCLLSENSSLKQASLCCLKTVFYHPDAPVELLYANNVIIQTLIGLMPTNKITVPSILTNACKTREHQMILASAGAISGLYYLLLSHLPHVQQQSLQFLAFLIFTNGHIASLVLSSDGPPIVNRVVTLLSRDKPTEVQLSAARCVTYLYRCGAMTDDDSRVVYKALPCLVRMTKKDETVENRILSAETLAYLVENSAELQQIAAISNHLIPSISQFLWERSDSPKDDEIAKDLRKTAFKVFASLGANDEDIRKRIMETDHLMEFLVSDLEDSNPKLQMAAISCLHSLSRSVQLLRTSFQDHPVWQPMMEMLSVPGSPVETSVVASSTLCNLLLEFSPSKEPILDCGAIDMLCALTRKFEVQLRLNGVWGLMNMAFQTEQRIKVQIITSLGSDQIFRLLSDKEEQVVMKTLGLLRNLLSNKSHIDHIMALYGKQVMQSVVLILEGDYLPDVKEQALCILGNIADGDSAKDFIMSNEDVLKKVTNYMLHNNRNLQIAAVYCIQNLIWTEEEGSFERQNKLREMGVYKILRQILTNVDPTMDSLLLEKVKGALNQFS